MGEADSDSVALRKKSKLSSVTSKPGGYRHSNASLHHSSRFSLPGELS